MECKSLRESGKVLRDMHVVHFGASCDPIAKNKEFAEKLRLDYPLLSDTDKKVATKYGILTKRGFSNRVTYIIDPQGKIAHIFTKVNVKEHGKQVAAKVKELKFKSPKKKAAKQEASEASVEKAAT